MRSVVLVAGLLLCASAANAEDCTPRLITSLDMIDEADGRVAVAVGLGGAQHRMLLATSNMHSEIFEGAADAAGLHRLSLSRLQKFYVFGGLASGHANVASFSLGTARGGNIDVLVVPGPYSGDPEVVGVLAVDLLGNFDVELDFAQHKANLFASNACGRPAGLETYSHLAMDGADGRVTTTMALDGKPVGVAIDSIATSMRMRSDFAKATFGLTASSPGMTPLPPRGPGDGPAYHYPFHALTAEGVAINDPKIVLVGDPDALPCNGAAHPRVGALPDTFSSFTCRTTGDLTLGIHWMRTMHWYFDYKARTIYFTPAH